MAAARKLACGLTARAVFAIDFSIAFPSNGVERAGEDGAVGAPACTTPAGFGAGAFSGAFFFAESGPDMRTVVPSRIERGINIECTVRAGRGARRLGWRKVVP